MQEMLSNPLQAPPPSSGARLTEHTMTASEKMSEIPDSV